MPIEISARGAKFAEEADRSAELTDAKIDELERATDAITEGLTTVHAEIEQLREETVETVRSRG